MLVADGDAPLPKVIDFGIAKATGTTGDGTLLTVESQILGTPEYMSPEQASGSGDIDTRTDVYSQGVILYELLTGSRPVDVSGVHSGGLRAVLDHIASTEPRRPSKAVGPDSADSSERAAKRGKRPAQLAKQIRGELDWVLLEALEKDRTRRYESASALATDVQRYLSALPVDAGPPSFVYRATKFAARHRAALAAAALVLLALAGGVASLAWSLEVVKDERDSARLAQQGERAARSATQDSLVEAEVARDRADAARVRAAHDRDEAQEISTFLTDMLRSAAPRREGRDVRVRSIRHQAENRLDREFADRLAVRARIGAALGGAFGSLGDYERSRELAERSAALHRELYGPDDPETVLADAEVGVALIQQGANEEAGELLEDVIARSNVAYGPDSETTLRVRGNLAIVVRALESLERAEAAYRSVIADCVDHLGPGHAVTLNAQLGLVQMYGKHRLGSETEAVLTETIEALASSTARDEPTYLLMQSMHAETLRWRGELEAAVELLREGVASHRRVFGPEHPKTHQSILDLANLLEVNGRYEEALALADEAIPYQRDSLGPDHASTLAALRLKGVILWKMTRLAEAEEVLSDVRERFLRTLGSEHPKARDATNLLAIVYYMRSKYDQALEMWTEQFDAIVAVEGDHDVATIAPRVNLGMVYEATGRLDEAEAYYERGLELCLVNYGPNEDWTLRVQNNLAELYQSQGDIEAATELNGKVLAQRRRTFGPRHPDTLGSMMNHADFLLESGAAADAEQALALARRLTERPSDIRPAARELLARCHLASDQPEEAREILERTPADLPEDHALRDELTETLSSVPAD